MGGGEAGVWVAGTALIWAEGGGVAGFLLQLVKAIAIIINEDGQQGKILNGVFFMEIQIGKPGQRPVAVFAGSHHRRLKVGIAAMLLKVFTSMLSVLPPNKPIVAPLPCRLEMPSFG